ncbi:PilZ domain-containing protein [Desulfonema magnum]|uniref:PilZ domain-containing protein n=2 Tax=Desulfonema magnum TaxID=45655 RepID=A0A975BNI2_9BACT|nr:PilZ domain-containing protein [Desulfonema magnum]
MNVSAKKLHSCNYRAYSRNKEEAPIKYADLNTENYHDGKMCNISESGMYFESGNNSLRRGSEVCIKMVDSADIHSPEACDGYRAEVMWCRKISENKTDPSYGVGVRFMLNICDQCGKTVPYTEIQRTDDFLFLCPTCFQRLKSLPDGKLKGTLENYLMGNVI